MRERNEKFAFAALLVKVLSPIGGLSAEYTEGLLEDYSEELYQVRYNSGYTPASERRLADFVAKVEGRMRTMSKLDRITANSPLLHGEKTKQ